MNTTEVQGGSPDVASVLKYIAEREENLGKYSDKLRANVQRIFDVFGEENYCQVCGVNKIKGTHGKYVDRMNYGCHNELEVVDGYTPKLVKHDEYRGMWGPGVESKERIVYFEEVADHHDFVPKIFVSQDMHDNIPFHEIVGEDDDKWSYHLVIDESHMMIYRYDSWEHVKKYSLGEVGRAVIKELVKSGRLPAFIRIIAEQTEKASNEYKEVAEIAERMAQAISSPAQKEE